MTTGLKRRTPKTSSENTTPIDNLEPGDYEARLVYVADLGLQDGMVWNGEKKPDTQQIALGLELIGQTATINDEEHPRVLWTNPFNVFNSLTERGNELKYYKVFDPKSKPGDLPHWEAQLNKVCTVTVVNEPGKNANSEKMFDNIASVSTLPDKYHADVEEASTAAAIGDADDLDNPCTKALFGLPKWVWEKRIDGNKESEDFEEDVPY